VIQIHSQTLAQITIFCEERERCDNNTNVTYLVFGSSEDFKINEKNSAIN
jgi:hypothetical protein